MGETPVPVPPSTVDDNLVTPGVWGFIITFAVVVAVVLLVVDMVRRLRRVNYRAEVLEQIAMDADARAKDHPDQRD
ncbi:MAG TPA: hypothetical protein VNT53_08210 [Pseudolysinimonas sp.]|nr:hypothetical protein [Pseudolysinimonas sp.]